MAEVGEVERMITKSGVPVVLHVAAEFEKLPVVRAVAETIAILGDFTLDDVADVKLAVDEVCSVLIAATRKGSELTCSFASSEIALHITVSASVDREGVPNQEGFGWHVLETLMDFATVTVAVSGEEAAPEREVTVELIKRRGNI
ncbi:MAG: ATP-binding protein [Rhodococcus sp. (in: high G+C Gram-positive bacteria)]|uniref:ATP-binding protein n=1 Tax=Rhodococcus sp. TaxID=1831 RepID=UPI003BB0228D